MSRTVDPKLEGILRDALPRLPAPPVLDDETSLAQAGLDSLTAMEILVQVEEAYAITISDDVRREDFDTPGAIWALVERARGAGGV